MVPELSVELFLVVLKDRKWNVENAINAYFAQLASASSGPDVTVSYSQFLLGLFECLTLAYGSIRNV